MNTNTGLIKELKAIFQEDYGEKLSKKEKIDIARILTDYFEILGQISRRNKN